MTHGHEIAMALRGAYWALHRRGDALLARHGVTSDQFVLLSLLDEESEAARPFRTSSAGGVTQQELVRRASSDPDTVRAMLVLLERGGLVSRRPHGTDRRARSVALTVRGARTLKRLWTECGPFHAHLAGLFAPGEAQAMIAKLKRIAQSMTTASQETPIQKIPPGVVAGRGRNIRS